MAPSCGIKETMHPCQLYPHAISLVGQVWRHLRSVMVPPALSPPMTQVCEAAVSGGEKDRGSDHRFVSDERQRKQRTRRDTPWKRSQRQSKERLSAVQVQREAEKRKDSLARRASTLDNERQRKAEKRTAARRASTVKGREESSCGLTVTGSIPMFVTNPALFICTVANPR